MKSPPGLVHTVDPFADSSDGEERRRCQRSDVICTKRNGLRQNSPTKVRQRGWDSEGYCTWQYVPHNKAAFHGFGHLLLLLLISVLKVICSSICGKESKLNLGR